MRRSACNGGACERSAAGPESSLTIRMWDDMRRKLLVHRQPSGTSVALLEDGQLAEYYREKPKEDQAGCIYKGRVVNVLPGMRAAFVDIGQQRNAFLYVDDLLDPNLEKQPPVKPSIDKLVKTGQELLVQVVRESSGNKGAKVTTHFSIPGRYLVYMPYADYVGVSRKIESEEERARLRDFGERLRREGEGLILRTVAKGADEADLERDLKELRQTWDNIVALGKSAVAPSCLFRDLDIVPRMIRDLFNEQVDELVVDDPAQLDEIRAYVRQVAPDLEGRIFPWREKEPMFERFGVTEMLEKAFRPKIWLGNGAYLVIEQTEALTVIDVNTGKYTGSVDLEQTVYETNLQAAEEIARLIRLRDIGGIIIADFIDMEAEEHREAVLQRMEETVRRDRTKTIVVGWTQLGLLEMTRKKIRSDRDGIDVERCQYCGGTGKRPVI